MEVAGIRETMSILSNFGLPGLILFMWWWDSRKINELLTQYREHMVKQERWYENNVELVKAFKAMCESQQDLQVMITTSVVRMEGKIDNNAYCPMIRNKKTAGWSGDE